VHPEGRIPANAQIRETMEYAIQTRGLVKTYRGVEAVRGIDLEVQRNTIFGFLGPNGAGKTTTIKLLLGLVRPTRGTATVFGQDIGRDTLEIRRRVGYLAQDPRYYEHMTARETLQFTARFFFRAGSALDKRIQETLELVGLADRADRPIRGFSGGERQRLGIAQAQINHPDLLILDEPAASLDPMGRRDVLAVMANLREHTTIFYSTHILDDVQRVSDTVAIMHQGKLVAQAPIAELLSGRKGETTYTIDISGEIADARRRIDPFPWIARIDESAENGGVRWQVHTTDAAAAEATLLRSILSSERVTVTAFGKQTHDLEDVFLRVVEEADNAA
jgi:ABC-2 type transport system ATP-binding protein